MKYIVWILFAFIFLPFSANAQNITFSGKVYDYPTGGGVALPSLGAIVSLSASQIGAITEMDGSFSFTCPIGVLTSASRITAYQVGCESDSHSVWKEDVPYLLQLTHYFFLQEIGEEDDQSTAYAQIETEMNNGKAQVQ